MRAVAPIDSLTNSVTEAPPGKAGSRHEDRRTRWILSAVVLGLAYFVAGKAGLFLAVGNASVSVVWPASGIAIAALILGGSELWPAVFTAAFLVNLTTTGDVASSLGIAAGNSLEALIGSYLAIRFASGRYLLDQPRTVLTFALLSGFLAATIAATIGTTSLILAHLASASTFLAVWGPWWLGDAIGAIEVTALILAISRRAAEPVSLVAPPRPLEAIALGAMTVVLAVVVFARAPSALLGGYPLIFLVLPPIIWAAFRFGSLGAIASVSTVSIIAILSTVTGNGPFATLPSPVSLLALRIFIGSVVVTALLVAADVGQHRRLETELYLARKALQRMLTERTAQLDAAKSLANIGNWSYQIPSGKIVWSDEMYRIFGYGEERFPVGLERFLERFEITDREVFLRELETAVGTPEALSRGVSERKYVLELPGGAQRTVLSKIQANDLENGRPTGLIGTVQDITERERIELELKHIRASEEAPSGPKQGFPMWMIPWIAQRRP